MLIAITAYIICSRDIIRGGGVHISLTLEIGLAYTPVQREREREREGGEREGERGIGGSEGREGKGKINKRRVSDGEKHNGVTYNH